MFRNDLWGIKAVYEVFVMRSSSHHPLHLTRREKLDATSW